MTSARYGTMLQRGRAFSSQHEGKLPFSVARFLGVCVNRKLQPVAEFPKIFHVFVRLLISGNSSETRSVEEQRHETFAKKDSQSPHYSHNRNSLSIVKEKISM